jgi:hypothetical protein
MLGPLCKHTEKIPEVGPGFETGQSYVLAESRLESEPGS